MASPPQELVELVRKRARSRCEYCRLPEFGTRAAFEIEHVVPRKHHGRTVASNLAWSCPFCNRHKGPNLSGIDPQTDVMERLFDPRHDRWAQHFELRGAVITGRTPVGRTTVDVLCINAEKMVILRTQLIGLGIW